MNTNRLDLTLQHSILAVEYNDNYTQLKKLFRSTPDKESFLDVLNEVATLQEKHLDKITLFISVTEDMIKINMVDLLYVKFKDRYESCSKGEFKDLFLACGKLGECLRGMFDYVQTLEEIE